MTKRQEIIADLSKALPDAVRQFESNFRSVGEYKPLAPGERLRRRDRRKYEDPTGRKFVKVSVHASYPREDLVEYWLKIAKRRFIDGKTRRATRPPQILFWKERPRVVYCPKTFTWTCEANLAVS